MKLPSDLISQFVKITKDTEKTKKETIVFGNAIVREVDGRLVTYAQIDGSKIWTPVNTSAIIKATDEKNPARVTIMIKDHVATITGCTSSPSARNEDLDNLNKEFGDVATTAELNKAVDRIKSLEDQNGEQEKSIISLNKTVSSNTTSITNMSKNVTNLSKDVTDHDTRLTTLENKSLVDWTDLTLNSDLFEAYSTNTKPRYKVNGNMVSIIGSVKIVSNNGSPILDGIIASGIQEQHRPVTDLSFVCSSDDGSRNLCTYWVLQIKTNGTIGVINYGLYGGDDIPPDACLTFAITYSI